MGPTIRHESNHSIHDFLHGVVHQREVWGGTAEVFAGPRDNFSQFLQGRRDPIFLLQLHGTIVQLAGPQSINIALAIFTSRTQVIKSIKVYKYREKFNYCKSRNKEKCKSRKQSVCEAPSFSASTTVTDANSVRIT